MTTFSLLDVRPSPPQSGGSVERIVDATLRCVARWGIAKTTVDDVAREAGVGRATLYRLFPGGRDALLDTVVLTESARFFDRLDARVAGVETLEELLVVAIAEAATTLAGHAAFQFLIAHEPETILPHLTFQQMDDVLGAVATFGAPYLTPWLPAADPEAAARAAEWLARIVISYLVAPSADVDLCDPVSVRAFVRTYILPGLAPGEPTANTSQRGNHA
ncbi:MAG: TetR/AcrR family transcriptional regulator [Acidimicrobiales bacterium]